MGCKYCDEHPGYQWDSLEACQKCDKGRAVQQEHDKDSLVYHQKMAKVFRKRIKKYKQTQAT